MNPAYVLAVARHDDVAQSARLLPATDPTILSAIFPELPGRRATHAACTYDRERDRGIASDAARCSFAETFGRAAERTIGKNLAVQPTLFIRPRYMFNALVDLEIIFPDACR